MEELCPSEIGCDITVCTSWQNFIRIIILFAFPKTETFYFLTLFLRFVLSNIIICTFWLILGPVIFFFLVEREQQRITPTVTSARLNAIAAALSMTLESASSIGVQTEVCVHVN